MEDIKNFIDEIANSWFNDEGKEFKKSLQPKNQLQFYRENFFKSISYNYKQFAKSNNIKINYETSDKIKNYINRLFDKFALPILNKDLETETKLKNKNITNFKTIVPKIIIENKDYLLTEGGNLHAKNNVLYEKFLKIFEKYYDATFIKNNFDKFYEIYINAQPKPKKDKPKEIKPKKLKEIPEPLMIEGKIKPMEFSINKFINLTDEESKKAYERAEEIDRQQKIKDDKFNEQQIMQILKNKIIDFQNGTIKTLPQDIKNNKDDLARFYNWIKNYSDDVPKWWNKFLDLIREVKPVQPESVFIPKPKLVLPDLSKEVLKPVELPKPKIIKEIKQSIPAEFIPTKLPYPYKTKNPAKLF